MTLVHLATHMPKSYHPPYDWGLLKVGWLQPGYPTFDPRSEGDFGASIMDKVQIYPASGLQMKFYYTEDPAPLSLAFTYDVEENWWLSVGAIGVSRQKFENVLSSLVCLRGADDVLMSQLQEELDTAERIRKMADT